MRKLCRNLFLTLCTITLTNGQYEPWNGYNEDQQPQQYLLCKFQDTNNINEGNDQESNGYNDDGDNNDDFESMEDEGSNRKSHSSSGPPSGGNSEVSKSFSDAGPSSLARITLKIPEGFWTEGYPKKDYYTNEAVIGSGPHDYSTATYKRVFREWHRSIYDVIQSIETERLTESHYNFSSKDWQLMFKFELSLKKFIPGMNDLVKDVLKCAKDKDYSKALKGSYDYNFVQAQTYYDGYDDTSLQLLQLPNKDVKKKYKWRRDISEPVLYTPRDNICEPFKELTTKIDDSELKMLVKKQNNRLDRAIGALVNYSEAKYKVGKYPDATYRYIQESLIAVLEFKKKRNPDTAEKAYIRLKVMSNTLKKKYDSSKKAENKTKLFGWAESIDDMVNLLQWSREKGLKKYLADIDTKLSKDDEKYLKDANDRLNTYKKDKKIK